MKHQYNSVWYWPGIRRNNSDFSTLFCILREAGYYIDLVNTDYDIGLLPNNLSSGVQLYVNDPTRVMSNWWIGFSLGAAVAHIAAATAPVHRRPKRLTLINPFANRLELSEQVGFNIGDQWRLNPVEFSCPNGISVDLIISRRDERIPPDQGRRLIGCFPKNNIMYLELDADHMISGGTQQSLLATLLLSRV